MKIGDTVTCVNDSGCENVSYGESYTIVCINEYGNIGLRDHNNEGFLLPHFYNPERFTVETEAKTETPFADKCAKYGVEFDKEYKTREGKSAYLVGFSRNKEYPLIFDIGPDREIESFTAEGFFYDGDEKSCFNIILQEPAILKLEGEYSIEELKDLIKEHDV